MKRRGFALITLVFLMLILAIMAIALNRRAGMLMRMASNQSFGVQRSAASRAVVDHGLWMITSTPGYRTGLSGTVFPYGDEHYRLCILSASDLYTNGPAGYDDAIVVDCRDTDSNVLARAVYRYQLDAKPLLGSPGLDNANHIAMDVAGNLYVADTEHHRIRKITPAGTMTTVAGTGVAGYEGNDGPAVNAQLNKPRGIAVDRRGDLFIADTENHWIRKVSMWSGTISLYAGSQTNGLPQEGVFNKPHGVCVSRFREVFVADTENHRIRKIDRNRVVSTFAGTGESGYSGDGGPATAARLNKPCAVAIGLHLSYVYVADTDNHCIRRIDRWWSLQISTVAGVGTQSGYSGDGGAATLALLDKPTAIHVDRHRNLFIADTENHAVRLVSAHTGTIRTLAGTGSGGISIDGLWAVESCLREPAGVAAAYLRSGREIFISDRDNGRIAVLQLDVEPLLY